MNSNIDPDRFYAENSADPLLERLGSRVRSARTELKMPRRVLSEMSGVSLRYLAQIEGGQGNISVVLLQRVSEALGLDLAELLGDDKTHEEGKLVELYRKCDASTRKSVLQRLEASAVIPDRGQRICLIGLRGAGKSTLGQLAGDSLDMPFVELNKDIEAQGGMPVPEIMALYGAEGYRQLESEAVRRVAARHDRLILAVAGGIVSESQTYETLLARFHTIWVEATPEDHMARVRGQGDLRPMEGQPEAMNQLRALLATREKAYARADARLNTSGRTAGQSLVDMLRIISEQGFLD